MLKTYVIKDIMVISLIRQDPIFKKMTPDDVLEKSSTMRCLLKKINHVKNLSKGVTSLSKQDIAFKASKKGKCKKVVKESSSEEEYLMIVMMRAPNMILMR
jgi:hypothetical protein